MADLYPVVSPLHEREEVEKIIELYSETLQLQGVSEVPTEGVVLVLVCTGGTERFIVEAARINPQVILLAHEKQNSLPAALEAREKLKVMDIHSKIIFGLDDASLAELESAIQIFEVVQTLRTSRIGIFGFPSPWLINLPHFSRAEHLFGTTFVHIDLSQVVREVSQTVSGIEFEADRIECTKDDVKRAVTLYQALKNIVEREKLHALGIKCFDLIELLNTTGCLAVSLLNDAGIPAGCEADMPATVTMYIVQLLTGTPPFMGNLCSVSENEILLAHCTIATQLTETVVLKPHFESGTGVSIQGTLPKGPVTLAKLDAAFQKIFLAEGDILEPVSLPGLCRTQVKVHLTNAQELLEKSLGNHLVLSPGKHKKMLKELCNYYKLDVVEI